MLPSKRPLHMGNILNVAPKIGNINLPTLIIMLAQINVGDICWWLKHWCHCFLTTNVANIWTSQFTIINFDSLAPHSLFAHVTRALNEGIIILTMILIFFIFQVNLYESICQSLGCSESGKFRFCAFLTSNWIYLNKPSGFERRSWTSSPYTSPDALPLTMNDWPSRSYESWVSLKQYLCAAKWNFIPNMWRNLFGGIFSNFGYFW